MKDLSIVLFAIKHEAATSSQFDEKNELKSEDSLDENNLDDDENQEDQQNHELISLLANVEDDELEDVDVDDDNEGLNNQNFKINNNKYKVGSYIVNSTDGFNFTSNNNSSSSSSNSNIKIIPSNNCKQDQVNSLINISTNSNGIILDSDALNF